MFKFLISKLSNLSNVEISNNKDKKNEIDSMSVKGVLYSNDINLIEKILNNKNQSIVNECLSTIKNMKKEDFDKLMDLIPIYTFEKAGYKKIFHPFFNIKNNQLETNNNLIENYVSRLTPEDFKQYQKDSFAIILDITRNQNTSEYYYDKQKYTKFLINAMNQNSIIFDKNVYKEIIDNLSYSNIFDNYYLSQYLHSTNITNNKYEIYKAFTDFVYEHKYEEYGKANITFEHILGLNLNYDKEIGYDKRESSLYYSELKERRTSIIINNELIEFDKKDVPTIEKFNLVQTLYNDILSETNPILQKKMLNEFINTFDLKFNDTKINIDEVKSLGKLSSSETFKKLNESEFNEIVENIEKTLLKEFNQEPSNSFKSLLNSIN